MSRRAKTNAVIYLVNTSDSMNEIKNDDDHQAIDIDPDVSLSSSLDSEPESDADQFQSYSSSLSKENISFFQSSS